MSKNSGAGWRRGLQIVLIAVAIAAAKAAIVVRSGWDDRHYPILTGTKPAGTAEHVEWALMADFVFVSGPTTVISVVVGFLARDRKPVIANVAFGVAAGLIGGTVLAAVVAGMLPE